MFTGIVEEIGLIISLSTEKSLELWDGSVGEGFILVVQCKICFGDIYIGASISVNGICLTVTEFDTSKSTITFGIAPETIKRTNILKLVAGDGVNLERAAKMSDRNSGHYVQGHVDITGEIVEKRKDNDSLWVYVKVTRNIDNGDAFKQVCRGIVKKGFVAIDGTSLTVCEAKSESSETFVFGFMLVQYTQNHIVIPKKKVGEFVNIEIDVMGKYMAAHLDSVEDKLNSISNVPDEVTDLKLCVQALTKRIEQLETSLSKQ